MRKRRRNEATADDAEAENKKQENEQIAWLKKHIAEYGFVFRYPEDVNEKGHLVLRYVGVEKAKEMTEKGLRLEDIG